MKSLAFAIAAAIASFLIAPPASAQQMPALQACYAIEHWIKLGGTLENAPGWGVLPGTSGPLTDCTKLVARITHAAHAVIVDAGETLSEVDIDFDIEQDAELWFSRDGTGAAAWATRFHRHKDFRLRAHGYIMDCAEKCDSSGCSQDCSRKVRKVSTTARMLGGPDLQLFALPGAETELGHYFSPLLEDPQRIIDFGEGTSIDAPIQARLGSPVTLEELRGLREGRPLVREAAWKEGYWSNRLRFELRLAGGPGELAVTPAEGLQASGPDEAGKYTPSSKKYRVKNAGKSPLDFSIAKTRDWLDVAPAAGTLAAGEEREVTLSVNERARALKAPDRDTVRFVNRTSGSGDTTRPVEVGRRERWRITIDGWDTLYFGDSMLAGGLKARWRIVLDLVVEGERLAEAHGTAAFGRHERYSQPPGVYDCVPLTGTHLDRQRVRHPTPYIRQADFPVTGSAAGRRVQLTFAPGNYYVIGYHCLMDTDLAVKALEGKGAIRPEHRVLSSRTMVEDKDVRHLPSGLRAPLEDGWSDSVGRSGSFDAHEIRVQRVK